MLGPDFPLPVNLQARDFFFFQLQMVKKNSEGMIRKVARNSRTAEWVGYSKGVHTAYSSHSHSYSHSILLKNYKIKLRRAWVDRRMGWGRKCQSKPLAISHFISLSGNMSKSGRREEKGTLKFEGEGGCV